MFLSGEQHGKHDSLMRRTLPGAKRQSGEPFREVRDDRHLTRFDHRLQRPGVAVGFVHSHQLRGRRRAGVKAGHRLERSVATGLVDAVDQGKWNVMRVASEHSA